MAGRGVTHPRTAVAGWMLATIPMPVGRAAPAHFVLPDHLVSGGRRVYVGMCGRACSPVLGPVCDGNPRCTRCAAFLYDATVARGERRHLRGRPSPQPDTARRTDQLLFEELLAQAEAALTHPERGQRLFLQVLADLLSTEVATISAVEVASENEASFVITRQRW